MVKSSDLDPAAAGWFVRAYYTPVGDALHGTLSARLDVRHTIAAAGLPAPVGNLIYTVCRRTRLWRREKHDVARELAAHFADGLSAGRSADDLTKDFGPPEQAAKLIRRAKLRNRPLWWQGLRVTWRLSLLTIAVVLLAYGALSARFYLGRPSIAHNYWHDINAARTVPETDRAWPLYREAAFKLGKTDVEPQWLEGGPAGKRWQEAIEELDRRGQSLALARQGAGKPRMGYLLADPRDRAAALAANAKGFINEQTTDANDPLISALLPGVDELRRLARLLAADARRAAFDGDGATALADLTALMAMSEQLFEPSASLVEQLVGTAFFGVALDTAGTILAETPAAWSDEQLRDLAHRIAAYRGGNSLYFDFEQFYFDDLLQRAYTDDREGDGRITPEGLGMLAEFNNRFSFLEPLRSKRDLKDRAAMVARLAGPGVASWMGTREENRAMYRTLLAAMIAAHQGPPWQWDWQELDGFEASELGPPDSSRHNLKYWLVSLLLPAVDTVFHSVERSGQNQDALQTAIALELWHRRHGQWPTTLDELVPRLLPAVPVDRTDGRPLRYVLRDGRPLLYSIGEDRDDDGGRPASNPDWAIPTRYGTSAPPQQSWRMGSDSDGDWILWPSVKVRPTGEAADAASSP